MAILFSLVTASVGEVKQPFLLPGIPKDYNDLSCWCSLHSFFPEIKEGDPMHIHGDAYLHGTGEWYPATLDELVYVMHRIQINSNFLSKGCTPAGQFDFEFKWNPEKLFD